MDPKVVFEDNQILVINKPAGMVTVRAKTVKGKTVQDWVEEYLKTQNSKLKTTTQNSKFKDFYRRAGIVHRLDKETSGLLLVAKTPEAFVDLQKQFKERKVKKKYLALVHGKVESKKGKIRVPVGRLRWDRKKFGVKAEGKKAETRYKILKYYDIETLGKFSFVELQPKTGRTHQIRVHLKYFGHPIVADSKYVGKKRFKRDQAWCRRLFLHATYLGFYYPKTEKWVEFGSPLSNDLKDTLSKLKKGK